MIGNETPMDTETQKKTPMSTGNGKGILPVLLRKKDLLKPSG